MTQSTDIQLRGRGTPIDLTGLAHTCELLGVAAAQIWAVLSVETRGFGFFQDRRPQLLFERHIFHKLTDGRYDSDNTDVSNRKPGGYLKGSDEYIRLEKALQLDKEAALQSTSWGIGQVMGFNFKEAGFSSTEAMVTEMVKDENSQLIAMAKFIKKNNLAGALQRKDWAAFARGYNGKNYKINEYDTRLAAAYARFKVSLPDLTLRRAQAALLYIGIDPGGVDGYMGKKTRAAILAYQGISGLQATAEIDGRTEAALLKEARL